jgi:RHS repeat-associated protein
VGSLGGSHATQIEIMNSGVLSPNVTNFLNSQSGYNTSKPKAFINWILFDERFNYVSASSGFDQVDASNTFKVHTQTGVSIAKSGYLYVYVSNETPNIDVFFDNLQVTHIRGALAEETHYYPFGLTMGISSKALNFGNPENKYKFVKQLLDDDLGLNLYQFKFRNHDPQIGRFIEIDPLANDYEYNSTYAYAENRVINGIDLEGKEFFDQIKQIFWDEGIVPITKWVNNNLNPFVPAAELITGKSLNSNFTEDKPRTESLGQLLTFVNPEAKAEGIVANIVAKDIVKTEVKEGAVQAVKKIDQEAIQRGVNNEGKVLKDMNIPKNNKTFQTIDPKTGKSINVKPDGIDKNIVAEVKDRKSVSNTAQIRGERQLAKQQGKEFKIVTGEHTKVSKTIPKKEVITRKDIGPQN